MQSPEIQLKGVNYKAERLRLHTWPYVHACMLSRFICVHLFATPRTVARQAPLSMGLSRWEYCSGLPFPSPGYLSDPGIEPESFMSPALAGVFFTTLMPPGKPPHLAIQVVNFLPETSRARTWSTFSRFTQSPQNWKEWIGLGSIYSAIIIEDSRIYSRNIYGTEDIYYPHTKEQHSWGLHLLKSLDSISRSAL